VQCASDDCVDVHWLRLALEDLRAERLDRPLVQKYGRALTFLGASVVFVFVTFLILGTLRHIDLPGPDWLWFVVRGAVLISAAAIAFAYIFRLSPNRHQPQESWLIVGSGISTVIWAASTLTLAAMWRFGNSFGHTYGRLAGVMAFIVWAYLISVGLHIGLAFAAQLEAVRSGRSQPQDPEKTEADEDVHVK
jgi:uncharacterized BrkB/YihY/UPF0761 family membrane protein